jgi:membrane-bound lytic murein transglycosylase B
MRVCLAVTLGLALSAVAASITLRDGTSERASAAEDVIASVAVLVPDERLDPRIAALELGGSAWTRTVAAFDDAHFAVADNDRRVTAAQGRLVEMEAELVVIRADHFVAVDSIASTAAELKVVESILTARALAEYVNFGTNPLAGLNDPGNVTEAARGVELGRRVEEVQLSNRQALLDHQAAVGDDATQLVARAIELNTEIGSTRSVIDAGESAAIVLARLIDDAAEDVRRARWSASLPGTDLTVVALDAYLNAGELLAEAWPACNARWWMLAGVARIESRHGRYGGRSLRSDGRVDRPIIGIALDGGPGVRAMVDTDGGKYDGDLEWDRAVGPLQFIPETWLRRGRDGSSDGFADPQNMYDAAYSAGRYLCALGGNLGNRTNLRSAYFGYNNSSAYVADVIGHADRYADFALPELPETIETVDDAVENGN